MDQPPDTAVLTKLRKLMAMAEGTTHPSEADAFSRKAAELVAKHRIDPTRLAEATDDELGVAEYPVGRGAYVRGRLALLTAVAEAHGCSVLFEQQPTGTVAFVAGFRSDLAVVDVLFNSLHQQASTRMAGERRGTGAATQRWRRSFLFGYADEIAAMLEATATKVVDTTPHAADALPVLRQRDEAVGEYVSRRFGRTRRARRPQPAGRDGFEAGQREARRADLGKRRVGGRKRLVQGN